MANIFISSTGKDLAEYRQRAIEVCNRLGHMPIAMEFFESMGKGATAGSKAKLDKAHLYVGIFAHRYGYIEEGFTQSVTEIEFDYACERKLDRLCFVIDPDHPWPPKHSDPENHGRLTAFKKRIDKLIRKWPRPSQRSHPRQQHRPDSASPRESARGVGVHGAGATDTRIDLWGGQSAYQDRCR